jgi:hypothetical protein
MAPGSRQIVVAGAAGRRSMARATFDPASPAF